VFSENFKKLNQQLLDRPDAYIQDFRLLSEAVVAQAASRGGPGYGGDQADQRTSIRGGSYGGKTATASSALALTVEGSSNLGNFVKFRQALAVSRASRGSRSGR